MNKFLKWGFVLPLLAMMFSVAMVSCGDDDDDESVNYLVGTWGESNVTLVLNSDNTGSLRYDYSEWDDIPDHYETFSYSSDGENEGRIVFKYKNKTIMNYYTLVDHNTLVLYYDDFDLRGTYSRIK